MEFYLKEKHYFIIHEYCNTLFKCKKKMQKEFTLLARCKINIGVYTERKRLR